MLRLHVPRTSRCRVSMYETRPNASAQGTDVLQAVKRADFFTVLLSYCPIHCVSQSPFLAAKLPPLTETNLGPHL